MNGNEWAVVTGASKGIGYEYCKLLLQKGYNLVAAARNTQSIEDLRTSFPNLKIITYNLDLSNLENVYYLYEQCQDLNVSLLINNAGFGVWGEFEKTDLNQELNMINLNISCLHVLTKLFVKKFSKYGFGKVINLGSIASFMPGPAFSSYYATKAYVLNLSVAINTELKAQKSKVRVVAICPGPIKTDFWNRAVNDKLSKEKDYNYGVPLMELNKFCQKSLTKSLKTKNKNFILLGFMNHLMLFLLKIVPRTIMLKLIYKFQIQR